MLTPFLLLKLLVSAERLFLKKHEVHSAKSLPHWQYLNISVNFDHVPHQHCHIALITGFVLVFAITGLGLGTVSVPQPTFVTNAVPNLTEFQFHIIVSRGQNHMISVTSTWKKKRRVNNDFVNFIWPKRQQFKMLNMISFHARNQVELNLCVNAYVYCYFA